MNKLEVENKLLSLQMDLNHRLRSCGVLFYKTAVPYIEKDVPNSTIAKKLKEELKLPGKITTIRTRVSNAKKAHELKKEIDALTRLS